MKTYVLPLLFVLIFSSIVYPQLNLNITIKSPTPSSLSEWQTDPTIVQITITNPTPQSYPNSYISFSVINEQGTTVARTEDDDPTIPRINIPPNSTLIFNGPQLFNINSVTFDPATRSIAEYTNSIPEGNYQFCAKLYSQSGINLTSTGEACRSFFIIIPDPPTLISPIDDQVITSPYPNFVWTSVTNLAPGAVIKYKLKICPVFLGQSPRTAIESNPVLLEKDITSTSYLYLPSDLPFSYYPDAIGFVWIVQALNQQGAPATRNEGKSELGTFRLSGVETAAFDLNVVYPAENDTLPWNPPHLVVRYTPYSDDIRAIRFTLRFRKEGSATEQVLSRQLNFPSGPMLSQGLSAQQEASLLIVNVDSTRNIVSWMQNLEAGKKYLWSVEAEFVRSTGDRVSARTTQSSFVYGLKKPQIKTPVTDSAFTAGRNFNIVWQVPRPAQLNFSLVDVLQRSGFHAYGVTSTAVGKFSLEFSKTNTFDTIYRAINYQIPTSSNYNTGSNCDSLFAEITRQVSITDTGIFYWRVRYLGLADELYFSSEPRRLRINPVTSVSCFEMNVQVPQNNSTISNLKPRFSVSIRPQIRKSAITGGRIKIWAMTSRSQLISEVKAGRPVLDTTFTGNDNSKLYAYTTDMGGYTRYDINFINTDTSSVTFNADTGKHYVWNFILNFNKDSIRADGMRCDSGFVVSNDGIFSVSREVASDTGACPGNCVNPAPTNTTISTQRYAQDSVIKIGQFDLKLKSVSGSAASLSGEGEIDVPYLRAPILVEFNGLKVNTDNQVFDGEAFAKFATDAPYTVAEGNNFTGQVLNMANEKLKDIDDYLKNKGFFVTGFTGTSPVGLPIGFDKDVGGGHRVVIAIIGMKFSPTQAVLNASMYVELPELGPDVGFGLGARNICFHKTGIAGSGQGTLYLAQDFGYRRDGSWSLLFKASTPSEPGTYATWDCRGFKEFLISAEAEFPRSWLKPVPDTDPTKLVKARFNTKAEKNGTGWQWMASANLEECEITSTPGFKLQVLDMVFDYSTTRNPDAISFPRGYTGTTTNEWKGFFIRRASLIFPDKLKTFEEANPSLIVDNLIIDRSGFTANIAAANIIQYPRGNFGKWGASIDSIKMNFVSSSLQNGLIKGRIKISIADSSLLYSGTLSRASDTSKLRYQFLVVPSDTISSDIWKAKLNILPSSRIELTDTSGKFVAQAILNGSITVSGNLSGLSQIGFNGILFEGFGVSSEEPYFRKGNWSFASPQHSLAGFPVSISNIDVDVGSRGGSPAAGLRFTIGVNLQPDASAISGNTTLSIWGKLSSSSGPQHFVFDGAQLEAISINADLGSVRINGSINLFNSDPVYGNGFRGAMDAVFVNQFEVSATAQFGSVSGYRYWYVDAKFLMSTGIPLFSGVGFYGFGGGAWYHMSKTGETNLSTSAPPPDTSRNPGRTNSGYTYTPNSSISFGFRATIILGTHPTPDAFNGDVSLEAEFLSGGGINRISILGNGYMLCGIANRSSAKVRANVNMEYNFPTRTFHGIFTVNINATPFTGGGQMVLHFAPDLWFIKIGEPDNRVSINLASWLSVGGYFMVGMNLPAPPPLPPEIRSLFPGFSSSPRSPDIQVGNGFAFGASIDFNTGRKTFLIFYGQARFLGGFDMALLNYREGTTCEGISGTIGVNGWYAMGQIYAYASASIGLHVDLWFVEGDFEILSLAAGAALEGAGPNPTWIKGAVGGSYSILGGAVRGRCSFEFKLGTECRPVVESPLARMDLISDVNPVNGATNVDVFIEPQVAMNFELNTPFELQEMPSSSQPGRLRIFRINLRQMQLTRRSDNQTVAGNLVISQDKYSAYFSPHDVLGSNTQYRLRVTAYGEEFISGSWQPARKNDGSIIEQTVEISFTSGNAPDYIYQSNVAYTYPLNGHKYFLQDECRNGVVQLKTGQPDLFVPRQGYNLELITRFVPLDFNLQPVDVPFIYNSASKTIYFNIPPLQNSKAYFVQIIKKEVQPTTPVSLVGLTGAPIFSLSGSGSQNMSFVSVRERVMYSNLSANVYLVRRTISASRVKWGEKLLYVFYFRTSQYNSLQEKLASYNYTSTEVPEPFGIFEFQKAKYTGSERFDYYDFKPHKWEKTGITYSVGPLVKILAGERTATWHNNFANPHIYNQIQWIKSKISYRYDVIFDKALLGLSATDLVEVEHQASPPTINDVTQMVYSGTATTSSAGGGYNIPGIAGVNNITQMQSLLQTIGHTITIQYNHGMVIPNDYILLKLRAAEILSFPSWIYSMYFTSGDRTRLNQIANKSYEMMLRGNYPLKFMYNYWGCRGPDDTAPTYRKWFVY